MSAKNNKTLKQACDELGVAFDGLISACKDAAIAFAKRAKEMKAAFPRERKGKGERARQRTQWNRRA